jgi:hypothetical protein
VIGQLVAWLLGSPPSGADFEFVLVVMCVTCLVNAVGGRAKIRRALIHRAGYFRQGQRVRALQQENVQLVRDHAENLASLEANWAAKLAVAESQAGSAWDQLADIRQRAEAAETRCGVLERRLHTVQQDWPRRQRELLNMGRADRVS